MSSLHFGQGSRCILAGDHLQLPPTVQSIEAEKKGLGRTLFARLAALYGNEAMSMLTIEAHASVAAHTLYNLDDVQKSSSTEPTLILIDIAGCVSVPLPLIFCGLKGGDRRMHCL
eukprot:Gb_22536 [translate_table: standard]